MTWNKFYKWLELNGYHVYMNSNVFRGSSFITDFDPQEDRDSGEIEETMQRIQVVDTFKTFKDLDDVQ
jgi:hypothetical protein